MNFFGLFGGGTSEASIEEYLNEGAVVIDVRTIEEFQGTIPAFLACAVWLFMPANILIGLVSLEGTLQVFFLSRLVYKSAILKTPNLTNRDSISEGLLLGLIILSRLDGIFIVFGFIVCRLATKLWMAKSNIENEFSYADLIISAVIISLMLLPWILWSLIGCNMLTPVSGAAIRVLKPGIPILNGGRVTKWTPEGDSSITFEAYPLEVGTDTGTTDPRPGGPGQAGQPWLCRLIRQFQNT